MFNLRTKDEIQKLQNNLIDEYHYHLFNRGYKIITAKEAKEIEKSNCVSKTISDEQLGSIEGYILATITITAHYDTYSGNERLSWLKYLASVQNDKIYCYLCRYAMNNPNHSKALKEYDYQKAFNARLPKSENIKLIFLQEIASWYFTPREFGGLRGFMDAVHWTMGENIKFNEDDYDLPINWERFYNYLVSHSNKLKRRNIIEMPVVFQMMVKLSN